MTLPRPHPSKRAFRALGIAECFLRGLPKSLLAGVVMRGDLIIDGAAFSTATVGGMDATDSVLSIIHQLNRPDINVVLLNGCVISWYNVIDLSRVYEESRRPLICVTYEPSRGLEEHFRRNFPADWQQRVAIYRRNGGRTPLQLRTGFTVYIRYFGLTYSDTQQILNRFTLHGRIPEPLRVAQLLARALIKSPASPVKSK